MEISEQDLQKQLFDAGARAEVRAKTVYHSTLLSKERELERLGRDLADAERRLKECHGVIRYLLNMEEPYGG